MMKFRLPEPVKALVAARDQLRDHYAREGLRFTFDGNLVGDVGEAVAADLFGLDLHSRCAEGVDGFAADGRTVQVKTTGTGRGPAFRPVETKADFLIFLSIDFGGCFGEVIYNGPEHFVTAHLPAVWSGQRMLSMSRLRKCQGALGADCGLPLTPSGAAHLL